MSEVFHLGLSSPMLAGATLAIIPGDPERVTKIAALTDKVQFLSSKREYTSYLGYLNDQPVVICSTGIGGPSTSIAVEELAQLGIKTFLRVGTTGAIQEQINVGDVIVTQASVRLDGASQHFAPIEYPAVANFACTTAMVNACRDENIEPHIGITASSDTFYPGQERYDTVSGHIIRHYKGSMAEFKKLGVLNYEMESSTLFTMCSALGLRAACLAGVIVNRSQSEIPSEDVMKGTENKVINLVVNAAKKLMTV